MGSYPGGYTLVDPNSFKCLEVLNGSSADGTKIQIRDCGSGKAQQWKFGVRSAGTLRNAATGKCLHLPTFDNGKDAVLSTCDGSAAQKTIGRVMGRGTRSSRRISLRDPRRRSRSTWTGSPTPPLRPAQGRQSIRPASKV
ncbi:RICIN domain-containing protein [Streptomyces sp. NPDC003280]|uniref:RICIN domain-containing protein n=1 Tax=Streptomyces sp. NPDC003280 TaxID=3364680 RepID=UPI0036CD18B7